MRRLTLVKPTVLMVGIFAFGLALPGSVEGGCRDDDEPTQSVSVPAPGQSLAEDSTATVSKPGEEG